MRRRKEVELNRGAGFYNSSFFIFSIHISTAL